VWTTSSASTATYYIIRARHVLRIEPKLPDFGYVCYLTVRRSGSND